MLYKYGKRECNFHHFSLAFLYFERAFNKTIISLALLGYEIEKNIFSQHEEMRSIFIFQTLAPLGINRNFSFL